MATLNFQIDRKDPPLIFYTPVSDQRGFRTGETVLAQSGEHPNLGYLMLGVVSRQTPYGQQGHFSFSYHEVRRATPDEVRAALNRDHELGASFVPGIMPHMNLARYQLIKLRWKVIAARQCLTALRSLPRT